MVALPWDLNGSIQGDFQRTSEWEAQNLCLGGHLGGWQRRTAGWTVPPGVSRVSVLGLLWGLQAAAEGVLQTGCGGDLVGSEVLEEGFRRVVCSGFYPPQVPHHSPSLHPETAHWGKKNLSCCSQRAEGVWNSSCLENVCSRWFLKGFVPQPALSELFKVILICLRWWLLKTLLRVDSLKVKRKILWKGFEIIRILAFKIFVEWLFLLFIS